MKSCPYCHNSENQVKAGKSVSGPQRMKFEACGRRYTPEPKEQGYPETMRQQAVKMAVDGLHYRRVGRLFHIDHKTVRLWVQAHADRLPRQVPLPNQVTVGEQDEVFTFIGSKKKRRLPHDLG